jgi:hypothetical protein
VIHERPAHSCDLAPVEWKLQGEQPLGVVLKEMSRQFCETFFIDRALLGEKIDLRFKPTEEYRELRDRLVGAIRAQGIHLEMSLSYTATKEVPRSEQQGEMPTELFDKDIHCKANRCDVTRSLFERIFTDSTLLAHQARFVPHMHDGNAAGFKMYAVRPGSLFSLLGFQNGDTIRTINGYDLMTASEALEALTKVRGAKHFTVIGERKDGPFTIEISIKD